MRSEKKIIRFLWLIIAMTIICLTSVPINAEVFDGKFYPTAITASAPQSIDNLVGHFDHKIKVIFSDIDGTLIPFNKKGPRAVVPQSVKKSANKLEQAKIPLFLITGRSGWEAIQLAKRVGVEKSYIIAQQGGQIINPEGKTIYQDNINHKDCIKILNDIEVFKKVHHKNFKIFLYYDGDLYTVGSFDLPYIIQKMTVIKSYKELSKINPKFNLNKIGIYDADINELKLIQNYLKKKHPDYHIDISADCYCDVTTSTATKGNAVKKLAEILNIDLKYAAVFGDSENDISMLNQVRKHGGLAIAVGNAMDSVKANANFTTAPVTEEGFAKAVDKILINNKGL